MNKISDEEEMFLREEKSYCMENLRFLQPKLNDLIQEKNKYVSEIHKFKQRYEECDRKLAFATKLTVVKRERGSSTVDALQSILKNKAKAAKLMELLGEEVSS